MIFPKQTKSAVFLPWYLLAYFHIDLVCSVCEGLRLNSEFLEKYVKELQIPENMRKMLGDVTKILLDTGKITKGQIEEIISRFDRGSIAGCLKG
jgi:excinuclease UvrABC ATPase subunit